MTAPAGGPRDTQPFGTALLRHVLVWLVAAKILVLIVVVDPLGLSAFDVPKSLLGRAIGWLTVAALGVALLRCGTSIVPRTRLHLLVAAYLGAAALSAAFAENRLIALFGERDRMLGLTFLLDMTVLYAAVAVAFRGRRDWAILGGSVAAGAAAAYLYGAVQVAGLDPLRWAEAWRGATFGNTDLFGHFLSVTAAAGASVAVSRVSPLARTIAAVLVLAALPLAVLTATRGAVLGIGAGAIALVLLIGLERRRRGSSIVPPVLVGALVALAAIFVIAGTPLGDRVGATFRGEGTRVRLFIWDSALRAAADRPVLGWGPDSFGVAHDRYRQPGSQQYFDFPYSVDQAHNWVLQQAVTLGLVGLAALVALIAVAVVLLVTRAASRDPLIARTLVVALAAYWAHALVSVGAAGVDWVPWVAFGGAAALAGRRVAGPAAPRPVARLAELALLGGGLALAISGTLSYRANHEALVARHAIDRSDGLTALSFASIAVDLDPRRAEYHALRGGGWQQLGLWREAAEDFARAAGLYPSRALYHGLESLASTRLAREGGDRGIGAEARALAAVARAVSADPNNGDIREINAEVLFAFGRAPEALGEVVRAIELFPTNGSYDEVAATIARSVPAQQARTLLERALRVRPSPVLEKALAETAGR